MEPFLQSIFLNLQEEHIFPRSAGTAAAASSDLPAWQPAPGSAGIKPDPGRPPAPPPRQTSLLFPPPHTHTHHPESSCPRRWRHHLPTSRFPLPGPPPPAPAPAPPPPRARRARQRVTAASAGASRLHRPCLLQTPVSHWSPPLPLTPPSLRQLDPGSPSSSPAAGGVPPPPPGHLSLSQINK